MEHELSLLQARGSTLDVIRTNMATCMGHGDRIGVLARMVRVGLGSTGRRPRVGRRRCARPHEIACGGRCRVSHRRSHSRSRDQFAERDARQPAAFVLLAPPCFPATSAGGRSGGRRQGLAPCCTELLLLRCGSASRALSARRWRPRRRVGRTDCRPAGGAHLRGPAARAMARAWERPESPRLIRKGLPKGSPHEVSVRCCGKRDA